MREKIQVGFQTFVSDGQEEFGAVREISPMAVGSPSMSRTSATSRSPWTPSSPCSRKR